MIRTVSVKEARVFKRFILEKRETKSRRKGYTRVEFCEGIQCLREVAVIPMQGGTKRQKWCGEI